MLREGGASSTPRRQPLSAIGAAEYWIARSSRAMTAVFVAYKLRKRMSM
ncbi:hypothetical protein AB7M63_003563 [Bradyrhizobium japonicum]